MSGGAPKKTFRLTLEYDGTGYHGWQRQLGVLSIQEVIESRLSIMLGGEHVAVHASGRTDAGVHALGQVVHFRARTGLSASDIQRGLNGLLPADIAVLAAEETPNHFHARFQTVAKIYEYRVLNRPEPSALERNRAWHIRRPLSPEAMREALGHIVGEHDFSAFMASNSSVSSTVRTLFRAELCESGAGRLSFLFEADGFLRQMVRNLVGTVVEAGRERRNPEWVRAVLASRDRREAGMTAPAHGLYLVSVRYGNGPPADSKGASS